MNFRWLISMLLAPLVVSMTSDSALLPGIPSYDRTKQFRFKSRDVGGKKITVVSINNLDPERGRRSILMPEGGEDILQPASIGSRFHKFISPFEDQIPLNKTLNKIEEETKLLEDIEATLEHVKEDINEEKQILESANLRRVRGEKRRSKKRMEKQRRREQTRKERKKKRKQRRKEKAIKRIEKKKQNNGVSRKPRTKLIGSEACQYKTLRRCSKKLKLLPRKDVPVMTDFLKCSQRKKFLECVENRMASRRKACDPDFVARGNLPGLRSYIKKLFWTTNSCLLNEAMKGR